MFALPIRCDNDNYIFVLPKATNSQLNLPHGIKKNRKRNEKNEKQKPSSSEETIQLRVRIESVLRPEESL